MDMERSTSTPTSSGLTSLVEARLLSSKTLSGEVNAIISSLRALILPSSQRPSAEVVDAIPERPTKALKLGNINVKAGTALGSKEIEDDESSNGSDEDEDDGEGLATLSVGASEALEDGWESGTVDSEDHGSDGDNISSGDSQDSSDDVYPAKAPKATSQPQAFKQPSASESVFLPSLAVGFTRGDSDSEFDDDKEATAADGVRKNRRGQRARRA
jgi:hypothetical protein